MKNNTLIVKILLVLGQILLAAFVWLPAAGLIEAKSDFAWNLARVALFGLQLLSVPILFLSGTVSSRTPVAMKIFYVFVTAIGLGVLLIPLGLGLLLLLAMFGICHTLSIPYLILTIMDLARELVRAHRPSGAPCARNNWGKRHYYPVTGHHLNPRHMQAIDVSETKQLQNRNNSNIAVLQFFDILVQLILGALSWLPFVALTPAAAENSLAPYRIALVMWQAISLCVTAVMKEGEPGYRFHTAAFWPLILSLGLGFAIMPFGVGRSYFMFWLTFAQVLSIPYLIFSAIVLLRTASGLRMRRKKRSFKTLFAIRQIDFYAQIAILAGALLITVYRQRPLQESLLLSYAPLACWQTLSSLCSFYLWRDYAPWRSALRIPYIVLQTLFLIGMSMQSSEGEGFNWKVLLDQPAAQILVAAYLLISFIEWEAMDRSALRSKSKPVFS